MTTPDGRVMKLPDGVEEKQVRAIFAKFRNGEQPTAAERQICSRCRRLNAGGPGGAGGRAPAATTPSSAAASSCS